MSGGTATDPKKAGSVDLTKIGPTGSSGHKSDPGLGSAVGVGPPEDLGETRRRIAYILLGILAAIIAVELVYAMIFSGSCFLDKETCQSGDAAYKLILDAIGPVFTAMIGLVGSVVGFYFGSQSK